MAWSDGISGVHLQIARSTQRRIGVLAGPGTGKTSYGLMRRVARLLEEGVPGHSILLLSFTRVAAADLRDKVAALGVPGADDVRATTLHSYCFSLLQRQAVLSVTGRAPRILLDHEVDLMLRDLGSDFGNIFERRRRLEAFVAGWSRAIDDYPGMPADDVDRAFQEGALRWLRGHKCMLIGEVVPLARSFVTTNPASEELTRFSHIIVDEYQDLNALEQSLLDRIAADGSLCIAGDDDQSIYSVRYANPAGIAAYLARGDVESFSMSVCGRCPEPILSMANAVIGCAPNRSKPPLTALSPSARASVSIIQWPDNDAEVEGISAAIAGDVVSGRREPGDILVLTNRRRIGEAIRRRLAGLDVPVRSFFTQEAVGSVAGRDALALLRLVVDDEDAPALRVLLGSGDATGRALAYQRLLAYGRSRGETPKEVLARIRDGERTGLTIPAVLAAFSRSMARVEQLRTLELAELVDALFPNSQLDIADLRAVAIEALIQATSSFDLLAALVEAITQESVPQHPDFVRVMSLHKSKGLTSPSVYILGAVQGVIPTITVDDPVGREAAMNEGRRLFYVALTRASKELVISSAVAMELGDAKAMMVGYDPRQTRRVQGQYSIRTISSPYIAELGRSAPTGIRGEQWLRQREEQATESGTEI